PNPALPLDRVPAIVVLPLLIWIATRFGPRETVVGVVEFTAILAVGTAHGLGPFVRHDADAGFRMLVIYAVVVQLTMLVRAATIQYHRRIEDALHDTFGALDERIERQSADLSRAVSALRGAIRAQLRVERYADAIVQTLGEPLLVLDAELKIRAANP